MEDLKGVTKKANRFLQNWSYFDLQTKIEYKAKEQGISVIYINPHYTSQRCSKCGFIHEDNRPEQARFKCQNCGFEENADYNASQNIAVRDIDKIISANMKQT
jgi:transposase